MTETNETRSVTLTRRYDAPIDLVWSTWSEERHVTRWMKCDRAATLELEGWMPAVGREFRMHMFLEGAFDAWTVGRFTDVRPPRLLGYETDPDPKLGTPRMHVKVELSEVDGGTQLVLTHSGIPDGMLPNIIEGGWTNSLEMIAERLAEASVEDPS